MRKFSWIFIILSFFIMIASYNHNLSINERALIHAIGIDSAEDGKLKVTIQIFQSSSAGSDTPIDPSKANFKVYSAEHETIDGAMTILANQLGREIFIGHLQLVVFGQQVDFSNPQELLAYFFKEKNVYLGVNVALAKTTAEEIISTPLTTGALTAENYENIIDKYQRDGETIPAHLIDFIEYLDKSQPIALPLIEIKQPPQSDASSQSGDETVTEPALCINETAIIANGKTADFTLDSKQCADINWLTDKIYSSNIDMEFEKKKVTLNLKKSRVKKHLSLSGGKLVYTVDITVIGQSSTDFEKNKAVNEFSEQAEKAIENSCKSTINDILIEKNTDVFELWVMVRHYYPEIYLKYKDNLESLYKNMEFEVNATCNLK